MVLMYYTELPRSASAPAAAQLQISTKKPTLALEALEDQISSIECANGELRLIFATTEALESVYKYFNDTSEFFVITSHDACNEAGERSVYLYAVP